MDLVNIQFAILLAKFSVCTLSGIIGFYFIFANRNSKRSMKVFVSRTLLDSNDAFSTNRFARVLAVVGLLLIAFSAFTTWHWFLKVHF